MGSVLGVSVGASAIRMARPAVGPVPYVGGSKFDLQAVDVIRARAEELAAESIGVALESRGPIEATGIAYRSAQQAKALRVAMAGQYLENYQLVPEVTAIVEYLESTGELAGLQTIAVYDLGSSGLSISVVDVERREVRYSERTSEISGDYFDSLIREQQIASGRVEQPQSPAEYAVLDLLCRDAKHQLTANSAVAIPSTGGLVLLTRDNFDSLVRLAIEASARLTRDVVMRSDLQVQAIAAVGGGSRVPSVAAVLQRWLGVPVIVSPEPESIAARGAAMLARPVVPVLESTQTPAWLAAVSDSKKSRRREISGSALAASSLAVVAAIGLTLGYGGQMLDGITEDGNGPTTTLPKQPPRTTIGEPSIAVAPIPTFVNLPTTTTTLPEPVPQAIDDTSSAAPQTPPPPSIDVPGIGPIILTPPPLPPLPELPELPPPPPLPEIQPPVLPELTLPPLPQFPAP